MIRVATYQVPIFPSGSTEAIACIRARAKQCEAHDVRFLCCPEAIVGGLADNAENPESFAIDVQAGELDPILSAFDSAALTTIFGFSERAGDDLFNSVAVARQGSFIGIYRKLKPAVNRSVYAAGKELPVFSVDGVAFGILICYDSNFPELSASLADRGAKILFIPSNNALPPDRPDLSPEARACDVSIARANKMWVVRSDVAGKCDGLVSTGSSCIADPSGNVLASAKPFSEDLLIADIDISRLAA